MALAEALKAYDRAEDTVVIALPRGGLVVAGEVAEALGLPLDIVVPRKIASPSDPEYALGALVEEGEPIWGVEGVQCGAWVAGTLAAERKEARRRLERYREGRPAREFRGKTAIVVDDGLATGLTMESALRALKAMGVRRTVMAVPHGAKDSVERLRPVADEVMALETPAYYGAVGEFYEVFPQVEDEEAISIMKAHEL